MVFSSFQLFLNPLQHLPNIRIDADRLAADLVWAFGLAVVQAGVSVLMVLKRHLPERVFDDPWGVMFIAHHFFGDHLRLMFWQHSGLHK